MKDVALVAGSILLISAVAYLSLRISNASEPGATKLASKKLMLLLAVICFIGAAVVIGIMVYSKVSPTGYESSLAAVGDGVLAGYLVALLILGSVFTLGFRKLKG